MSALLAVDVGLHSGLALFGDDGRHRWSRSQNFGALARLRRAAPAILDQTPGVSWLILEGGGALADIWQREGQRRQIAVRIVSAEEWRGDLLYARQQRSGEQAKRTADALARRVLAWSGCSQPKTLRHDAAEAILIGLWWAGQLGWIATPQQIVHGSASFI
jgi:hypothetical protein